VQAYRTAAKTVREASVSVAALAREGRASELPGIGKTLQEKMFLLSPRVHPGGGAPAREVPAGLIAITRLPGLGPKRARLMYDELGIDSVESLRARQRQSSCVASAGWAPSSRGRARGDRGAAVGPAGRGRARWADPAAAGGGDCEELLAGLSERAGAGSHVQLAGSLRRQSDSVKDLDLIATTEAPQQLAGMLGELEQIERVSSASPRGHGRSRTPAWRWT